MGRKAKVLIVDDEEAVTRSIVGVLEDEGFETIVAQNGKEALQLYRTEGADVVLLDIWMPDMDGIDLLRKIKEADEDCAVIMISGHGTVSTAVKAMKLGAFDFMEKPLSMDVLLSTVNKALKDRQRTSEVVSPLSSRRHGRKPKPPFPEEGISSAFPQRTLKQSMVLYGTGLHSGTKTGMILLPQPPNTGILFCNLTDDLLIPGTIDHVISTDFATSVGKGRAVVRTIEHLMAVLHAYGITNLLVKINGEVPIMDGSAAQFCEIVEEAGVQEQEAGCQEVVIDKRYQIGEVKPGGKYIYIEPADHFGVRFRLLHPPPIGEQEYTFILQGPEEFKREIAPARTYGFVKEIGKMREMGLAGGGHLDNVILLDEGRVVNTELRFPDELVRHKILDLLGDFYLFNRPIKGMVTAQMTGHTENIALLKEIKREMGL
ncbi:MAG: UDP-3-O-[3-hydroxymyristoyl] N-acetylglucosamine deacetylase [Deltaproteobacteria bacterium]|nr:MAG: UDP-3-O-[3-hydroxymyristoyl] N-acetylglucosamine deacetylase [Deltaproteobacteria bacterium]